MSPAQDSPAPRTRFPAPRFAGSGARRTYKVLLDTDLGDNIDDALALGYLLTQPSCDLLGITTVGHGSERRIAMARELCRSAGRSDVPVIGGAQQASAAQDRLQSRRTADGAANFLLRTIRRHSRQVTLLAIGPLTNIASLFEIDPAVERHLGGLVLMGGSFCVRPDVEEIEHNVRTDPEAAAAVYSASPWPHRSVGLDVTRATRVPADAAWALLGVRTPPMLRELTADWNASHDTVTFNDPLAAAGLFAPDLCGFERGTVRTDCEGDERGRTRWSPSPTGRHEIAVDVDRDRFYRHYAATMGGTVLYH